jgi:hypothetical protein
MKFVLFTIEQMLLMCICRTQLERVSGDERMNVGWVPLLFKYSTLSFCSLCVLLLLACVASHFSLLTLEMRMLIFFSR